jgi:MFS transporter, FLVCR family, feline leukemia virus subgroup C receptor-related protein
MVQVDEVQSMENAKGDKESVPSEFKVYKRRWTMLALYISYTVISSFQWIQYAIIADVIVQYYNVPYIAVNWTSTICMLAYVVTIIPATWFYNKKVRFSLQKRSNIK